MPKFKRNQWGLTRDQMKKVMAVAYKKAQQATRSNAMTKKDGKDKYPLQVYVIALDDGDEPMTFFERNDAMSFAREQLDDSGGEEIVVGVYTLSGLKKLRTQVIEEDA